nr:uroporphyrinogen decarboxylase family protein [uncultured Sellimonas sp.]
MHKDDQMTPKERAFALFAQKPVDRMPIKLFSPYIGMNFGATYEEAFVHAKSRAHWLIESYRRFGQDGLSVNYRIDGIPVAFGAESTYDPTGIPIVKNAVLKSLADVSQLSLENVEFKNDINAQIAFDAVRYVQDELADEVFTGVGLMGPFTTAANLAGTEVVLKAMRKDPKNLHKLLDFAADATIEVGRKFVENQMGIGLAEPTASLLSPKQFREFVIPYYKKVMDTWKSWGSRGSGFHICGDTSRLLETFPEMGIRGVSIDSAVDIAFAKEKIGTQLSIMGNVSPIEILQGTPESIASAVKDCFAKCWDNPCGFTIAPGCDIPVQTSLENIDAYMAAARQCAKYPVQPLNWEA